MDLLHTKLADRAYNLHKASCAASCTITRSLIALSGPPGSGKSNVAAKVAERLTQKLPNQASAAVLPMDGFHLTRATLDALPNSEEAHARRGISWTFDAQGVVDLVAALHESRRDLVRVHKAPGFDHALKDPVKDNIEIGPNVHIVIVEGNWLLYDEHPWSMISALVDDTWFVDVDPDVARRRVATRHVESCIEGTWEAALYRAENNDMLNGVLVREKLVPPAVRIQSVDDPRQR